MAARAVLATILLFCAAADALAQHTVPGAALDAAGAPLIGSVRLIVSRGPAAATWTPLSAAVAPDGTFTFANVPSGEYLVQAFGARGPGRQAEFGVAPVSVTDRDPRPVTVRTSPGAVLEGVIVVEGQPQSRAATVALAAVPSDAGRAPGSGHGVLAISRDGTFYLTGLYGRARLALATASDGWYLKSVRIGRSDATDREFDFGFAPATFRDAVIQVANATGVVSGRVARDDGGAAGGCAVIVFSTREEKWFTASSYVKGAQADADGSFRVAGLPPADYFVAAVAAGGSVDTANWQAPDTLRALASMARRVTIGEGELRVQPRCA